MPDSSAFQTLLLNAWAMVETGGVVMIPIVLLSLLMWSLIVYKLLEVSALLHDEKTVQGCRETDWNGSVWQREVVADFNRQRNGESSLDRRLLQLLCNRVQVRSQRFVSTILVLASLMPLLGLLGTVCGMLASFEAISIYGTGNIRALADGISTALITTQTGLIIAVPGLVLGEFIRRRIDRLSARIDCFRLALLREYGLDSGGSTRCMAQGSCS